MACPRCRSGRKPAGSGTRSRREVLLGALALGLSARAIGAIPARAQDNAAAGVPPYIPEPDTEILIPIDEPLTPETVTFRVLVARSDEVTDYDNNAFTRWLEEKTNVHVQWDLVPEEDIQSKLNVMLASGDLPDIIFGTFNPSQLVLYGSQGIFVGLNELIAEHAPRATKLMEVQQVVRDVIAAPDGSIYAMPSYGLCYPCTMGQKLWLYKPWLDTLGLTAPQTTDELEQVLLAFKEQDPNGNGQADEIPLSGSVSEVETSLPSYFMNSFTFNPVKMGGEAPGQLRFLIVLDGEVTPIYATDEWREGLRYLNRLHRQGLIDPQILTQDLDALQRLGNNPDEVILGGLIGHASAIAISIEGERWSEYVAVPPVTGPAGVRYAAWNPYQPASAGAAITSACDDPGLAVAWIDTLLWQEATLRQTIGVLNENWRWALEGELGVDGEQALWKVLEVPSGPTNQSWQGTVLMYFSGYMSTARADDRESSIEQVLHEATLQLYEPYQQPLEMTLPPLAFTPDQAVAIADQEATIGQYVQQMLAQFVRGEADLDADWETYLGTLAQMGLASYIQTYQDAYDAKSAR